MLEYFSPISEYTTKTEYITIKEYVGGGGAVCPSIPSQQEITPNVPVEETIVSDDTLLNDTLPSTFSGTTSGQQF